MSVFLAGLSALFYGAGDYLGGRATRRSQVFAVLIVAQVAGLAGILVAAPLSGAPIPPRVDFLWGLAAGASGALGLSLLYRALATTVASVASPAAALVGAAAPVIAGAILGEQPGLTGWIGIGLAIPAVLLLTLEKTTAGNVRLALLLGMLAGVGFGGFFILISRTSDDSGLWPLAATKISAGALAAIAGLLFRSSFRLHRRSVIPAAVAGFLDMAANIAFLGASRIGLLATSSVVSSLYPAPTVLLAALIDRERLPRLRVIGLLLALAGVALMTL